MRHWYLVNNSKHFEDFQMIVCSKSIQLLQVLRLCSLLDLLLLHVSFLLLLFEIWRKIKFVDTINNTIFYSDVQVS